MQKKQDERVKNRAAMISKLYDVLDSKQKEQFKTLLDLKAQKMQNRFDSRFN